MGAQGTTTVDFGAFPGSHETTTTVTGQAAITGSSLAEAWLWPVTTADHSSDEHLVETIRVMAGNVVAGTGFTIYAFNSNQIQEPLRDIDVNPFRGQHVIISGPYSGHEGQIGGAPARIYGQWTVA